MKKQLSALIDGEVEVDDAEHVIKAMKSNEQMKDAWKHYHLIGDAIRDEAVLQPDFSARVLQALDAEPTVLAINKQSESQPATKRRVKTPVYWSVAASVAAVMFVGLMVFELELGGQDDLAPVEIAKSLPLEYLQAHQSLAPSGASYYIQSASFTESHQ